MILIGLRESGADPDYLTLSSAVFITRKIIGLLISADESIG